MTSFFVVPDLNVLEYRRLKICFSIVLESIDTFLLKTCKPWLNIGAVMAVSSARHAWNDDSWVTEFSKSFVCVLRATIRMNDNFCVWISPNNCSRLIPFFFKEGAYRKAND